MEKESQLDAAAYTDIIAAKKEAVGLQLEASYRARLVEAHSAVRFLSLTQNSNDLMFYVTSGQEAS